MNPIEVCDECNDSGLVETVPAMLGRIYFCQNKKQPVIDLIPCGEF